MAGGIGSRFWPASRTSKPKQFLDILGIGKSLIRLTFERFTKIVPSSNIYVVTNERYRDQVKEHLPELTHNQILGEPSMNNTAPCVAYAAFKLEDLNRDANLLVAPSDHYIHDIDAFVRVINDSFSFTASEDAILTLGMKPSRPDTGYGYIELGEKLASTENIYKAARFTEKPDLETAEGFLATGRYFWNSGMFFFNAQTVLKAFETHSPEIHAILSKGKSAYNTEKEQAFLEENYPDTPSISIDYAIMEKSKDIFCYTADFGWSDLGTWGSLYDFKVGSDRDNVVINARHQTEADNGNLIVSSNSKLVVTKELEDFIIIDEDDVLLIYPRRLEQEIKQVRSSVDKELQ
ncbi:MAG: mannose-1-phosphate guanylyltransferase [Saprospiraceae bacterium]|nr:mannose-1-phosphate guanylyltransferase [Saprospiraceae bacterium]